MKTSGVQYVEIDDEILAHDHETGVFLSFGSAYLHMTDAQAATVRDELDMLLRGKAHDSEREHYEGLASESAL